MDDAKSWREIRDGLLNGLLARITVLGNEVAGVTGQHEIVHRTLPPLAHLDHFRDATKKKPR